MRPQIRSIPLSEIECPQFSWAIRNNSDNISAILQPDLNYQQIEGEISTKKLKNFNEYSSKQASTCGCIDNTLKPILFSRPATCVCTDDPCLPRDGIYKHYKLKMDDKAIGDIMEEIIMRKMPSSPPSPICRGDRWFKKTMISSHTPEVLRLEDENTCSECAMRESPLVRTCCNCQPKCNIYKDKSRCVEACKYFKPNYVNSFLERPLGIDSMLRQDALYKETNSPTSSIYQNKYTDRSADYKRRMYVCEKGCSEDLCKSPISDEIDDEDKNATETVKNTNDAKDELFRTSKTAEQVEKINEKSPRNSWEYKSPRINSTHWTRPDKLSIQRVEVIEVNPNGGNIEETKEHEVEDIKPLKMQEHFRNFKAVGSESSSKSNSKFTFSTKGANSSKVMNSTNQKFGKNKSSTFGVNAKKSKLKQKELHKYPWNFNNQMRIEDPMKNSSAHKKYPKLSENTAIGANNFARSRAGEDFGNTTQRSVPEYFVYKPNLVSNSPEKSNNTEECIKIGEQRKYKNGLGKMRVQLWYEQLEKYAKKSQESSSAEVEKKGENNNLKNHKKNNIFSDDDNDNGKPNKLSEILNSTARACSDKGTNGETYNQGSSFGQISHPERKSLQEKIPAENIKLKQSKTSILSKMNNLTQDANTGDQLHNKRKHIGKDSYYLSTIFEEFPERSDYIQEKQSKCPNETYRVSKAQKKCSSVLCKALESRPRSANVLRSSNQETYEHSRPRSADVYPEEPMEMPYFNVIRQKIHSRADKKLEDLQKFREEHFFETHDVTPYHQDVPEHTCVHRFTVDERLYPQPLHSNAFGVSCCIHCDQPMKNEKTVFSDQRQLAEKVPETQNVKKHSSKLCLRPKPVHIGSKNSVMEIKLGPEHDDLLKSGKIIQPTRTYYTNSLALRHQRR